MDMVSGGFNFIYGVLGDNAENYQPKNNNNNKKKKKKTMGHSMTCGTPQVKTADATPVRRQFQ